MRRKYLGCTDPRCFYCIESDTNCLEEDHPVTRGLDPEFTRIVCCNCHRKLEMKRDLAKLTKNGRHTISTSKEEEMGSYLLLMAEDQDSIAELLKSPNASIPMVADALHKAAASLRRKASSL
jgi:hypothetical protein